MPTKENSSKKQQPYNPENGEYESYTKANDLLSKGYTRNEVADIIFAKLIADAVIDICLTLPIAKVNIAVIDIEHGFHEISRIRHIHRAGG